MLQLWKIKAYLTPFMLAADLMTQIRESQRELRIGEQAVRPLPH